MAGALSTLGLGSNGVLTNDLIDKLKDADRSSIIKPIENSQESIKLQQAGLVGLKDSFSELSKLSTTLSDIALYQGTKSEVSGDAISVTTEPTAKSQTINLEVEQLATRDILTSYKKFENGDELFGEGSMDLEIDGKSFTIDISDTDTVADVVKKISEGTDGKIEASLLNVGGDEPYRMVLKSTDTGEKNAITVDADISFYHPAGGQAQDAEIRMDNILVRRSSNEFDDLVDGVTIKLEKEGESTIEIKQDSEKISETMESFVNKYNELLDSVSSMTHYDAETKVAGVFQGVSDIKNMLGPLKDIFSTTINSMGKMSEDYGISNDKSGKLTFDKDKFTEALAENPTEIKNFFIGEGAEEGIFRKMNGKLFDIDTRSDGVLKTLKTNFDSKEKRLSESLEQAQKRLDSKYDIMQKRFASFDAVIGRLSNASSTLTSLIEAQYKQ